MRKNFKIKMVFTTKPSIWEGLYEKLYPIIHAIQEIGGYLKKKLFVFLEFLFLEKKNQSQETFVNFYIYYIAKIFN